MLPEPDEFTTTETVIAQVCRMVRAEIQPETIHRYVEDVIIARVDEEREELAQLALELEVDPTTPVLMAAARRGTDYLADATATMIRREFALLCRSRKQRGENEPEVCA